jgi:hypothetical protein
VEGGVPLLDCELLPVVEGDAPALRVGVGLGESVVLAVSVVVGVEEGVVLLEGVGVAVGETVVLGVAEGVPVGVSLPLRVAVGVRVGVPVALALGGAPRPVSRDRALAPLPPAWQSSLPRAPKVPTAAPVQPEEEKAVRAKVEWARERALVETEKAGPAEVHTGAWPGSPATATTGTPTRDFSPLHLAPSKACEMVSVGASRM